MSLSNLTENQRHGMSELFRKIAPVADELGDLFAARGYQIALVGGSVRDVFLGRIGNDLDLTTDARPETVLELIRDWADSIWTIGIDFGTVGVRKGGWLLEITTYRTESYDRTSRKPEVVFGDIAGGRPGPARLRGQRDGAAPARPASSSTRTAASTTCTPGCCARPVTPERVLRRRPAADAPRRPVRQPAGLRRRPGGVRRDDRDGRADRDRLRRADPRRAGQAHLRRRTRARGSGSSSTPGSPTTSCPSCPRSASRSTSTTGTRTSTSTR